MQWYYASLSDSQSRISLVPKSNTKTAIEAARHRVQQIRDSRKFERRLREDSFINIEIIKFSTLKNQLLPLLTC